MSTLNRRLSPSEIRRARLHLALIPLYLWAIFTWGGIFRGLSTPGPLDAAGLVKGHDFVHFYVLGEIARERLPAELYDYDAQSARNDRVAGYRTRYLPAYGPQVAMFFAPFAALPYQRAWMAWAGVSSLLYAVCCYVLWRALPPLRRYRWAVVVAAIAYPPFSMLFDFGHITALALAAVTMAYVALRARRPVLAGVAFGCLFVKPPLAVLLPFVFLYAREWRVIAGAIAAVAAQVAVGWAWFGGQAWMAYAAVVARLGDVAGEMEPQLHRMQSLRSFFAVLLPWPGAARAAYVASAIVVVAVAARCWRSSRSLDVRFAVLLVAAVLVDPHVNVYDLVVLVPVYFLVAARGAEHPIGRATWAWLYFCYLAAVVVVPVSAALHVQILVAGLCCLLWSLMRGADVSTPQADKSAGSAQAGTVTTVL